MRVDEAIKVPQQRRVRGAQRLAAAARPPLLRQRERLGMVQVALAPADGGPREPGRFGNDAGAAAANSQGFGGSPEPARLLGQERRQTAEPLAHGAQNGVSVSTSHATMPCNS